jgi:signal transduction histidine kinase
MAEGHLDRSSAQGQAGNKAIAALVLDALATRGEQLRVERGRRALDGLGVDLASGGAWLADGAIRSLLNAVELEPVRARALGHRLLIPEATGLIAYQLGLATPEKAYRRASTWLPRDDVTARWTVERIESEAACLAYEPAQVSESLRTEAALCALRQGMLESIPGLYGLLPARIEEYTCVQHGADRCTYGVSWRRTPVVATRAGMALGALAAGILFLAATHPTSALGLGTGLAALGLGAISILGGRVVDLSRQLSAVAGARRGHLALFDQVDDALAEKLDALARVGAKLDGISEEVSPGGEPVASDSAEGAAQASELEAGVLARKIHGTAGDLEDWLDEMDRGAETRVGLSAARQSVRSIRDWALRIGRFRFGLEPAWRESVDPGRLVRRAIAAARPCLPAGARIEVEIAPDLPTLHCDPLEIEHLVVQLLRNAIEASVDVTDPPEAVVALRPSAVGVELCIEDRGVGIESNAIDEVFDPFFAEQAPDGEELSLKGCLRIVEDHAGELRFDNGSGVGTRVSVLLPKEGGADMDRTSFVGARRIGGESC